MKSAIRLMMVFAILWATASGQDKADKKADDAKIASKVRRLVRQLDADELAVRDQAEKDLIALGDSVLNHLPTINARTPAEVKERLGRVTRLLQTRAAEQATKESQISLNGEMSLQDALKAIEKQTGNQFFGADERNVTITAKYEKTKFWQALDDILDQANLNINPYGGQRNKLTLVARPEEERKRSGNAAYTGLFRFEATRIESTRSLRNPQVKGMRLQLNVAWEPRTTPISVAQPLTDLKAFDENDEEIAVEGGGVRSVPVSNDISGVELTLPFNLPKRGVHKIARLEGTLIAMMPGRTETFEFTNLSRVNQPLRKAGATVIFERMRKSGGLYEIRVKIQFDDASNALESHRGWITNNKAYMVDSKGKQIDFAALETTSRSDNSVGFAYQFPLEDDPKKCKFVYRTPALIVRLPIKYVLKDLPLP